MKRVIPVVLVLLLAAAGVLIYRHWFSSREPAKEMKLSGNVEAHESLVSFKVTGRIVDLPVEEGQAVEAGGLLAQLDNADYHQAVTIDEAAARVRDKQLALSLSLIHI